MKLETDVKLETMHREGESYESYLQRLRDMAGAAAQAVVTAIGDVEQSRSTLAAMRKRGATVAELNAAFDTVLAYSRALGKAKYERAHIEYTLAEAYVRIGG